MFRGQLRKEDQTQVLDKKMNASILDGDFAPIEIPAIEIPGSTPLIFQHSDDLLG